MLRFKNRLRNAVAKRRSGQRLSFSELGEKIPPLDVLKVEKAENAIIKYVQSWTFQDKTLMLRGDVRAVKKSSSIVKLDPILVNRILRVGGRLHYSMISSEARHPAILPKHHYISNLSSTAALPQNQWALRLRAHSLSYPAEILDYSSKSLPASHYLLVLQLQKEAGFCWREENVQFA